MLQPRGKREARAAVGAVLKIKPTFSVERVAKTLTYIDTSQIHRTIDILRKVGMN